MKLKFHCKYCGKHTEALTEVKSYGMISRKLECGHTMVTAAVATVAPKVEETKTKIEKALMPYQVEGHEFLINSEFRALLADDMGLGKTIQSLAALQTFIKAKLAKGENPYPFVIVCKSSLSYNWFVEFNRWLEVEIPRPIFHNTRSEPLPGFLGYIVSMDCLTSKEVVDYFVKANVQILIADEAHNFKNPQSARTVGFLSIAASVNHVILLSGTPLLNRISEYYTMLNILRPSQWPSKNKFLINWVEYDTYSKKYLGLIAHRRQEFLDRTANYVLRRTKSQVNSQLPELFRAFEYTRDITPQLKKNYAKILQDIEKLLYAKRTNQTSMDILVLLQKLWNIAGLAKVPYIAEQAISYLEEAEPDKKLCIGVHHKDVTLFLQTLLTQAGYKPIIISGADNADQKLAKENLFRQPENRLCIMSILAGGEGRNMQFCDTAFIAEQYWVPAKLEQFIGRFHRHGSKAESVLINSFLLADSIDEFFQNLLQLKQSIVSTAMDVDGVTPLSTDEIFDLAEKVISVRKKYV